MQVPGTPTDTACPATAIAGSDHDTASERFKPPSAMFTLDAPPIVRYCPPKAVRTSALPELSLRQFPIPCLARPRSSQTGPSLASSVLSPDLRCVVRSRGLRRRSGPALVLGCSLSDRTWWALARGGRWNFVAAGTSQVPCFAALLGRPNTAMVTSSAETLRVRPVPQTTWSALRGKSNQSYLKIAWSSAKSQAGSLG